MLGIRTSQQGLTLIEIMIGLVLLAILTTLAVPAYQTWIHNSQIRNAAEGILNGLQLARGEALQRNTPVELVMGFTSGWTVRTVNTGTVVQTRAGREGSQSAAVTITPDTADRVTFNGMGWVTPNNDGSPAISRIDVNSAVVVSEEIRPLRVVIGTGGAVKMCDPAVAADDPRRCF